MRLIIDSNVLFTFFWKDSVFNRFLETKKLSLYAPAYALEEIEKHSSEIKRKTGINDNEFRRLKEDLLKKIIFIDLGEYSSFFNEAIKSIEHLPEQEKDDLYGDLDFLALALTLNCPIWSNDKLLKRQSKIMIFSTKEMIILL